MININKKRITITIILALLMALTLFFGIPANQLKVHFLDVGQANSILLQLPNKQNMLIDAGNNDDSYMTINYIKIK